VWGRGTLDDKVTVLAVLEAVEQALAEGVVPARTVILAFGHDEEVGGERGARAIVEMLRGRGVPSPALVLDEGGAIFGGDALGVPGQVALVGIAEKGFLSLELRVEGLGGHSSTPPAVTHIGRLSAAIARLQDSPFPVALDGPTRAMLEAAAPLLPFTRQLALGNLWLTAPLVARALAAEPRSAAMVRTTTAPTIFQAGAKDNVLPPEARAVVNFRIRPGETVESVTQRVRDVISDTAVRVAPLGFHVDPSPVSDPDGAAFALVADVIRATLGDAPPLVAPYLVIGGTDARWWSMAGAKDVFRFNPFPFEDDAMQRFHGTDERIPVQAYLDGVRYYGLLLRRLDALR
jgi:carboxypeptidase PM20D1